MTISNVAIKKIIKKNSNLKVSDRAVDAITKLLEKKAKSIARYAVRRANGKGRKTVQEDDIYAYKMKFGD